MVLEDLVAGEERDVRADEDEDEASVLLSLHEKAYVVSLSCLQQGSLKQPDFHQPPPGELTAHECLLLRRALFPCDLTPPAA